MELKSMWKNGRRFVAMGLSLVLLSGTMLLSGCASDGAESTPTPVPTATETQPAPSESASSDTVTPEDLGLDPEQMDMVKYNIYVEMNNKIVEVLENIYSYYEVVEYADEFAFVPDSPYSYKYDISPFDSSLVDDAVLVAGMEPAFETLDDLTVQIAEPMRALMDTFDEIYSCYDFEDNQYAKAKEFHTVIQANVDTFEELAYTYMDAVAVLAVERTQAEEQTMLEEGRTIIYNASHAITVTRELLEECYNQGVYDDNIQDLDLTPIRPLYEELVATVDAYKAAVEDKNQLMAESLSSSPMYSLDSLVQAVDWMIQQVESGSPISDPGRDYLGGLIPLEGVPCDCTDDFNSAFAEKIGPGGRRPKGPHLLILLSSSLKR